MSWLSSKLNLDDDKELLKKINHIITLAPSPAVRKFQKKFIAALTAKGVSLEDADTVWCVLLDVLGA